MYINLLKGAVSSMEKSSVSMNQKRLKNTELADRQPLLLSVVFSLHSDCSVQSSLKGCLLYFLAITLH